MTANETGKGTRKAKKILTEFVVRGRRKLRIEVRFWGNKEYAKMRAQILNQKTGIRRSQIRDAQLRSHRIFQTLLFVKPLFS